MRSDAFPKEIIRDGERVATQVMSGECLEGRHRECGGSAASCTCVHHEPGFEAWCEKVRELLRETRRPMEMHDILRFRL